MLGPRLQWLPQSPLSDFGTRSLPSGRLNRCIGDIASCCQLMNHSPCCPVLSYDGPAYNLPVNRKINWRTKRMVGMATVDPGMRFSRECLHGEHSADCAGRCACGCHSGHVAEFRRTFIYPPCCLPTVKCHGCWRQVGTFKDGPIRSIRFHQCRHGKWCKAPDGIARQYCSSCNRHDKPC